MKWDGKSCCNNKNYLFLCNVFELLKIIEYSVNVSANSFKYFKLNKTRVNITSNLVLFSLFS